MNNIVSATPYCSLYRPYGRAHKRPSLAARGALSSNFKQTKIEAKLSTCFWLKMERFALTGTVETKHRVSQMLTLCKFLPLLIARFIVRMDALTNVPLLPHAALQVRIISKTKKQAETFDLLLAEMERFELSRRFRDLYP